MERNTAYSYPGNLQGTAAAMTSHHAAVVAHINPPASKAVLDRLAASLTPPQNTIRASSTPRGQHSIDSAPDHTKMWAYEACSAIINKHSKSFYFSARLLPKAKRHGIMALYAFCRYSDDIVDNVDSTVEQSIARARATISLNQWAQLNNRPEQESDHPVLVAWADTRSRHCIPAHLADDLLEGIRMDLTIDRYATWDDLWLYCYRVASTVGLMSIYVTGAETLKAVPYAVQLGVALQLTNILRDVGEDARTGRVYLPEEDMAAFGYTQEMLLSGVVNDNFVKLIKFQIARAEALYDAAMPGIALLPPDSRFAVTAAAKVYREILRKIEQANYDVFTRRAHLTTGEKLRAVPSIWWASKRVNRTFIDDL